MGRLFKISLIVASVLSSLDAQNAPSPAPLPPAMRSAIDRLTKKAAVEKRALRFPNPQATLLLTPTNPEYRDNSITEICSVPLIEMHIDNPERFTMLKVQPPADQDRMPLAQMPAPPCGPTALSFPALPPGR